MTIIRILFILFSAAAVIMALTAVTMRHSRRAALCLSAFLASVSVLFALLELYMPAALHLILSAVCVLVSARAKNLKNENSEVRAEHPGWKKILPAALISVSGAAVSVITIINFRFSPSKKPGSDFSLQEFISSLLSSEKGGFLLSLILLMIIAGAAVLAYKAVKEGGIENSAVSSGKKQHRNE